MRKADRRVTLTIAAWCALALAAGIPPAAGLAQEEGAGGGGGDRIMFKDGQQWLDVKITKETYKTVEVADKGSCKPTEIAKIVHADQPPDYVAAESNLGLGQYAKAIERFAEAVKAKARPWLKHYCAFYTALCKQKLSEGGKPDTLTAAAAEYEKVIKESPEGIKVPEAKFGVAECYYMAKQLDKAAATFEEIAKSDYGEFWQLRAKLWLGKILLDEGKGDEAAKAFDEVQKAAAGKDALSEVYFEAALSRASSLIIATPPQCEEARKLLKQILSETDMDKVEAAAHSRMGDSYLAEKRIQEARLEYLQVVVLYFDVPEEYSRALLLAADCTEKIGDYEKALMLWRSLADHAPQGTPTWWGGKQGEVLCLLAMKEDNAARSVVSSVVAAYPKLGAPDGAEAEKKFVAMMREKLSPDDYRALIETAPDKKKK